MQFSEVSRASPINNRESRRESWPPHPVNPGYNNPFHDPISPGLLSCFSGRRSNFQPKIRRGNTARGPTRGENRVCGEREGRRYRDLSKPCGTWKKRDRAGAPLGLEENCGIDRG